ncbi:MAG: hypothetical protein R3Y16_04475 [Rikenellaceae bacterium]
MTKKIFICGKVYEINTQNCGIIHERLQNHIYRLCNDPDNPNENLVNLRLYFAKLSGNNDCDITFVFSRINMFAKSGVNPEFINDSDGQLLMGMDGRFKPPVMWELVKPFASSRYHIPLSEFAYAYVESAKVLGASEIIGLQIESNRTELKLKINI